MDGPSSVYTLYVISVVGIIKRILKKTLVISTQTARVRFPAPWLSFSVAPETRWNITSPIPTKVFKNIEKHRSYEIFPALPMCGAQNRDEVKAILCAPLQYRYTH